VKDTKGPDLDLSGREKRGQGSRSFFAGEGSRWAQRVAGWGVRNWGVTSYLP